MNRADDRGGAGPRLRPVRPHQILHRLVYTTKHPGQDGDLLDYQVQIDVGREDGHAELYVDGRRQATREMPATFPVPGGVIEVATSMYGVRRIHLVRDNGEERRLEPLPGTLEHLRHRLHRRRPGVSRTIAWTAIAILAHHHTHPRGRSRRRGAGTHAAPQPCPGRRDTVDKPLKGASTTQPLS